MWFIFGLLGAPAPGVWPMWAGDLSNDAVQLMTGNMTNTPVIKWQFTTGQSVEFQFSAIADVDLDGKTEVVFGSLDHNIYCLDGATGTQEWSFNTLFGIQSSPAIADIDEDGAPEVVVGSGDGRVYCVRGSNGQQEWFFSTTGQVNSSPAIADVDGDGHLEVLIGSADHKFYCIASDGTLKWSFTTDNAILSSPAVRNVAGDWHPDVIFGSKDSTVYCLNGANGTELWEFTTQGPVWSSPVVVDADRDGVLEVLVGSDDGKLYCLNASNGNQEWAFTTGDMVRSAPAVADVDNDNEMEVIFGSWDCNVYCLSGSNGQEEWRYAAPNKVQGPGSLVDVDGDNSLEFLVPQNYSNSNSTIPDTLYCLNAEDGSLLWKIALGPDVHTPFAGDIDGDDCVEILTGTREDYTMYALDDPANTSGCGPLYSRIDERESAQDNGILLKAMERTLYLFLPQSSRIYLTLYDVGGRKIETLFNGVMPAGGHSFGVDVEKAGIYTAVLQVNDVLLSTKLTVQ